MERVYLVDKKDNIIGTHPLRTPPPKGAYRRGTKVLIFKDPTYRELLLQQRSKKMFSFPGLWDLPGGVVPVGETYRQCAERELIEEALEGLNTSIKLKRLFKYRIDLENTGAWNTVYRGVYNGPIRSDPKEVAAHKYVSITQLYRDIEKHPQKYTMPFRKLVAKYQKSTE